MRACRWFLGPALLLLVTFGAACAQTVVPSTPTSLDMIRLEPCGGEPVGLVLDTMKTVAERQSYLIYTRIDMNGSTPTYRLPNLRDDLSFGFGLWGQASHGHFNDFDPYSLNQWGFAVELWPTSDEAVAAGLYYYNNGIFQLGDFFIVEQLNQSWHNYALCVTPQFVRRYFYDWQTLVYDVTCSSLLYAHAWHDTTRSRSARVRLGYQGVCIDQGVPCNAREDENNLFKNMDGTLNNGHLSVYQAMNYMCGGSLLRVYSGDNQHTYLSPSVDEGLSYMPSTINSRTTARIVFPVDMDRSIDPYGYVLGTPAVRAYNPRWVNPRELQVTLVGRRQDYGKWIVRAYDPFASPVLFAARSDSGLIPMDGDGKLFNRDSLSRSVYSNYVDVDPAASVYSYTVTRKGADVVVRWKASQESATEKYLILVGPTATGPFEQKAEVQADAGTYMVTISGGPDAYYDLVEVGKSGETRDVCAEPVSATEPVLQDGSVTVTAEQFAHADSLLSVAQMYRAQNRSESTWDSDQYRIFTLRKYQRPVEWLRDFWNMVGLSTEVKYIEDLGGPLGIQTYSDNHLEMTAALLAGDASETSDPYGNLIIQNPSNWDTLGIGHMPTLPLQPELNQIPLFYRVSPDSVSMAMPYWRRYYGSPLPYFDRNRNGKPDDGIRFGVAPVSDTTEFWGFAIKTANAYFQWEGRRRVDLWGYFRGGTSDEWRYALALLDSLEKSLPSYTIDIARLTDSYLHVMTPPQRQFQAIERFNASPILIITGSIYDEMYSLGKFLQADEGARPSQLAPNPSGPTAMIRGCGGTAYNLTQDPAIGEPQMEPLLFTPDRGAYLIWGPNMGSDARGNNLIIEKAISILFANPYGPPVWHPFGDITNETLCWIIDNHPELAELAWQWILLGDPNLIIKTPGPPVVSVASQQLQPSLSAFPNPSRNLTVQFTLARPDDVHLEVYDVQGRRVATLASGHYEAGQRTISWHGQNDDGVTLASGLYLVRLRSSQLNTERKVIWLH
ncbi:MAG: FlgD immunoglobulin-like domain containing protein [Candidatus Kerfeldbacteria bacterium]